MPDDQAVIKSEENVPEGTQVLNQNYYQIGFWAFLQSMGNAFFTFIISLFTTSEGWMGMIVTYVLYCLATGRKLAQ